MVPVFPTAYFGNITYYKALFKQSKVLLEVNETYIKQSIRNRCEIQSSKGIQQLSIPVIKINGSKTKTLDIKISNDTDWKKNHWKSIQSAYASSPYFEYYGNEVEALIFNEETDLITFNLAIHNKIAEWLSIETKTDYTSIYDNSISDEIDFRNKFDKKNIVNLLDFEVYTQVFKNEVGFTPNLSILDAIFALGPMARKLID